MYGTHWGVVVGSPEYGMAIDAENGTLCVVEVDRTKVAIYKTSKLTETDLIESPFKSNAHSVVINTDMSTKMKESAFTVAMRAFGDKKLNSFDKIAKNVSDTFDVLYGKYWQCFVGPLGAKHRFRYVKGTRIALQLGEAQVDLFRSNNPERLMDPDEVLKRAKKANPVTLVTNMDKKMQQTLINLANDEIKAANTFNAYSIIWNLKKSFQAKYPNFIVQIAVGVKPYFSTSFEKWNRMFKFCFIFYISNVNVHFFLKETSTSLTITSFKSASASKTSEFLIINFRLEKHVCKRNKTSEQTSNRVILSLFRFFIWKIPNAF